MNILGPAGKEIASSGDSTEDFDARTSFVIKFQQMHRFVTEPNGTVTLVVGAETGHCRFRWSIETAPGISIPWPVRAKSYIAALARMN